MMFERPDQVFTIRGGRKLDVGAILPYSNQDIKTSPKNTLAITFILHVCIFACAFLSGIWLDVFLHLGTMLFITFGYNV